MMAGVAFKDVVPVLLERFPEFKETEDFKWGIDLEFSYSVWGAFGRFITNYIRRLPADELEDDDLVTRVFDLANELMDSDDVDTHGIVVIELFENFYSYQKTLELARRKLKQQHLEWLEKQGAMFRTSNLHYEGELMAPNGLDSLKPLLAGCSWGITVRRCSESGIPRMESNNCKIDLEMDPGHGPKFTFFGAARRDPVEARRLLGELSQLLAQVDIAHRIRLYQTGRADVLLENFHHRWPRDKSTDV